MLARRKFLGFKMSVKVRIFTSVLVGVLGIVVAAYYLEPRLLYFARKYSDNEIVSVKHLLHANQIELETVRVSPMNEQPQFAYMFIPTDDVSKNVVGTNNTQLIVLLGGNAMTALDWAGWVVETKPFITKKVVFLAVDYPGYGASEGEPSPLSMNVVVSASVSAAKTLLKSRGYDVMEMSILGHSIGAAVAARWATSEHVDTIILSAPFTSVADMVPVLFAFIPSWIGRQLLWHNWDTRVAVGNSNAVKTYIVHGEMDEIVPFRMGKELSEVVKGIQFIPMENTGHNDILSNFKIYGYLLSQ